MSHEEIERMRDIRRDYDRGNIDFLTAIESLQRLGYEPMEAEGLVMSWNDGNVVG